MRSVVDRNVVMRRIPELCVIGVLLACGDDDDDDEEEEDKAGRRGAMRGTTYLAGGGSRKLAALKVPRQNPIVLLVKIRDD